MFCKNYQAALAQARANANFSGVPWVVISDTCGNYRAERKGTQSKDIILRGFQPQIRATPESA